MQWIHALAGGLTGLVNGIFGGGGGMVLVPLLSRFTPLPARKLYPTCVAIILPVCLASAGVCLLRGDLPLAAAVPYLLGGAAGGWIGGRLYSRVSTRILRLLFAAFLLYAAWRYLT